MNQRQLFALDSALVNTHKMFGSDEGFLTYVMHHRIELF